MNAVCDMQMSSPRGMWHIYVVSDIHMSSTRGTYLSYMEDVTYNVLTYVAKYVTTQYLQHISQHNVCNMAVIHRRYYIDTDIILTYVVNETRQSYNICDVCQVFYLSLTTYIYVTYDIYMSHIMSNICHVWQVSLVGESRWRLMYL